MKAVTQRWEDFIQSHPACTQRHAFLAGIVSAFHLISDIQRTPRELQGEMVDSAIKECKNLMLTDAGIVVPVASEN